MTQAALGDRLGLTFQQIQKYEKGANRIGASTLHTIAKILSVPENFFFEELPEAKDLDQSANANDPSADLILEFLSSSEGIELNRAFAEIRDVSVRKKIVLLAAALAD